MSSVTRAPHLLPARGLSGHSTRGSSVTPTALFWGVSISCLLGEGEQLWHRGQGSVKAAETEHPSGGQLGRKSRCSAPWHGAAGSARVGFEDNAWDKPRRAALDIPRQRGDVLAGVGTDPNDSSGLAQSRGALHRVGEASREPQGAAAQARCVSIPNPGPPFGRGWRACRGPPPMCGPLPSSCCLPLLCFCTSPELPEGPGAATSGCSPQSWHGPARRQMEESAGKRTFLFVFTRSVLT